jgi:hypothetical protein
MQSCEDWMLLTSLCTNHVLIVTYEYNSVLCKEITNLLVLYIFLLVMCLTIVPVS